MHKQHYRIVEIKEILTFTLDSEDYDIESEVCGSKNCDLREALSAIEGGCWDNINERQDEVICYPADRHHNMHKDQYESTTVVVSGKPAHVERLMQLYYARRDNKLNHSRRVIT